MTLTRAEVIGFMDLYVGIAYGNPQDFVRGRIISISENSIQIGMRNGCYAVIPLDSIVKIKQISKGGFSDE